MKTTFAALALSIATVAVAQMPPGPDSAPGEAGVGPQDIPQTLPLSRYEGMVSKSPFALATPVVEAPPPDKTFAEGWYVGGIARFDGKDYVTIKSRDQSVQFQLFGDVPHPENGVSVKSVDWSPTVGRSTVTVQKDGELAKLEFNQAELQSSAPAPQPGPASAPMRQTIPGAPRQPVSAIPRPGSGPVPTTLSQSRRTLPPQPAIIQPSGPKTGLTPGTTAKPGTVPTPSGDASRRRIRFIPNSPQ